MDAGWPTVLLRHVLPDGSEHVDWLIAADRGGEGMLEGFRLPGRVDELSPGGRLPAVETEAHRPAWLHREGPVSGGRGSAQRLARGRILAQTRDGLVRRLDVAWDGGRPVQHLRLEPAGGSAWTLTAEE